MQTQTQTTAFKQWFSDHEDALLATARDIFAHPELSGEETYSSHRLAQLLEEAGFSDFSPNMTHCPVWDRLRYAT